MSRNNYDVGFVVSSDAFLQRLLIWCIISISSFHVENSFVM